MRVGIILGDVPEYVDPRTHVDLVRRQVEVGQGVGCRVFVTGHHVVYGAIRWLQPVPLLASLARDLDRDSVVGPYVLVAPLYDPILLAEELSTLDMVTEGRLVVGLGAGYRAAEFEALHIPFGERAARLEEMVPVLRRLWTEPEVTHHGEFYRFGPVQTHLRPESPPPIWMGAKSPAAIRRAARLGDVWAATPKLPFDQVLERARLFAAERESVGLPVNPVCLRREIVLGTDPEDAAQRHERMTGERIDAYEARELVIDDPIVAETRDPRRTALLGTPEQIVAQLRQLTDHVPVDPVLFRAAWPGMRTEDVEATIRELGKEVIPAIRELAPR